MKGRATRPVPFVLSCGFGAAGVVLLVLGALTGTSALSLAGFVAGSLSLAAALYWRGELITAWRAARRSPPG